MAGFKNDKFISKQAKNDRVLDKALEIWQTHSSRPLTREDAREIAENVVGFFRILQEWEVKEKAN
jgi:hypothetical protein